MSGERPTDPDRPKQISSDTPVSADTKAEGTLVVEQPAGIKPAPSTPMPSGDSPGDSHMSLLGRVIGPYLIRAELGAGGMGAVYLAEQSEPVRRQVALKVIKAGMDSEDVIARFQSEREMLALMNHPNIAQVLDVGATPEGRLYFALHHCVLARRVQDDRRAERQFACGQCDKRSRQPRIKIS